MKKVAFPMQYFALFRVLEVEQSQKNVHLQPQTEEKI